MIIIDSRFLDIAEKLWGKEHKMIPSFTCQNLQVPVSSHPDMTITPVDDVFVCCPESYEHYREYLGDRLIKGTKKLSPHYPDDIAYNVLIYKNIALGKIENLDPVLKDVLTEKNIKLIDVNQGYAKCSSAVCSEGIITADEGIYNTLIKNGINALKISQGYVKLEGYNYGFIGGATGIIDGKMTFFGDVRRHPDYLKIKSFCDFSYIEEFELTDVGTMFCI